MEVDPNEEAENLEQDHEEVETPESDFLPEERETEEEASPEVEDDVGEEEVKAKAESGYEPDFTYKVKDDEFEMPDRIKDFIKTKEDEEYFRDLLTAADGVSGLVEDRQILREDNHRLMQVEATRQRAVQDLQNFVQQGDLKPFMDTWGISDEQLARYMQHRLQLHELKQQNPAQYAEYERGEQARLQNIQMQNQFQSLQSQNEQLQAMQLQAQMDQALMSPDLNDIVQNYDSHRGQGAFRNEVIALGDYYYRSGRGIVPPEQLAREVASKWYTPQQPGHAPRQGAHRDTNPRNRVVQREDKPTLRKIKSSGNSPVRTRPKTIADIKRISEERYGS